MERLSSPYKGMKRLARSGELINQMIMTSVAEKIEDAYLNLDFG